jgi:transcriptional regulator of acetoin/glycerol metabolism
MMTAFATVETAVEAVKAGAYDYLTKSFSKSTRSLTVAKALERKQLKDRTRVLEERSASSRSTSSASRARCAVFKLVETVSYSSATVLIQGERHRQEPVARAIHYRSLRDKPFVAVNCSAPTDTCSVEPSVTPREPTGATGTRRVCSRRPTAAPSSDEIGDVPPATRCGSCASPGGRGEAVGSRDHQGGRPAIAVSNVDLAQLGSGKFHRTCSTG